MKGLAHVVIYSPKLKLYELSEASPALVLNRKLSLVFHAQSQTLYAEEKTECVPLPWLQRLEISGYQLAAIPLPSPTPFLKETPPLTFRFFLFLPCLLAPRWRELQGALLFLLVFQSLRTPSLQAPCLQTAHWQTLEKALQEENERRVESWFQKLPATQ